MTPARTRRLAGLAAVLGGLAWNPAGAVDLRSRSPMAADSVAVSL